MNLMFLTSLASLCSSNPAVLIYFTNVQCFFSLFIFTVHTAKFKFIGCYLLGLVTLHIEYQNRYFLDWQAQKYSRIRCLLRDKGLVICFYLGWSGSILKFRQNIIKVGLKSQLLTCSSNITLSLPSYTGSALKRAKFL